MRNDPHAPCARPNPFALSFLSLPLFPPQLTPCRRRRVLALSPNTACASPLPSNACARPLPQHRLCRLLTPPELGPAQ
jgi:hypothetical protein